MSTSSLIPTTLNFHVVSQCNYHCVHCFAGFPYVGPRLVTADALRLIDRVSAAAPIFDQFKIDKLTFAGGEPTLHPDLGDLVTHAKSVGLTTCVVTNGYHLACDEGLRARIFPSLNWLAVSLDSGTEETNRRIGRGRGDAVARVVSLVDAARREAPHVRIKLNTVVNALNWTESFEDLVTRLKPDRWKVLQVTLLEGENDAHFDSVAISRKQFDDFVTRHAGAAGRQLVPENEEQIQESYLMVDPEGRIFGNVGGALRRGESLLDVSLTDAVLSVGWRPEKFLDRGGSYDWRAGR